VQLFVATLCPCATSVPLACKGDDLAPGAVRQFLKAAQAADVLAVGPGMDRGPIRRNIVQAAVEQNKPVVLDADGLNNLCDVADWPARRACPLVLTPHPGELARLTGLSVADIQADRQAVAVRAVRRWTESGPADGMPLVLVLKGAGTVVTDGVRVRINQTGNPGMATGGSGDVLTGLTAALLAQGLSPFDAASLAVHLHGRAGDLAAEELSQPGMTAADLLDYLPAALKEAVS
jgi:NAD(P)H-hydrate epimerase